MYRKTSILLLLIFTNCAYLYPKPQPVTPKWEGICNYEDVGIDTPPTSNACVFAKLDVSKFRQAFTVNQILGVDVEATRGWIIKIHPQSNGTTFPGFLGASVAGEAWCQRKTIYLANFNYGIPHELVHAAEKCADTPRHPNWEARGICETIRDAGFAEMCPQ